MTFETEQLRREIRDKHDVSLGPDDPILMLVTANDYCVQRSIQLLEAAHAQALAQQAQHLELAAKRWRTAAHETSQDELQRATSAVKAAAENAAAAARESITQSVQTLTKPLQLALVAACCASALSLLACALLWLR